MVIDVDLYRMAAGWMLLGELAFAIRVLDGSWIATRIILNWKVRQSPIYGVVFQYLSVRSLVLLTHIMSFATFALMGPLELIKALSLLLMSGGLVRGEAPIIGCRRCGKEFGPEDQLLAIEHSKQGHK